MTELRMGSVSRDRFWEFCFNLAHEKTQSRTNSDSFQLSFRQKGAGSNPC